MQILNQLTELFVNLISDSLERSLSYLQEHVDFKVSAPKTYNHYLRGSFPLTFLYFNLTQYFGRLRKSIMCRK